MLSQSFFPNFGQGPFPKIAGKSPVTELCIHAWVGIVMVAPYMLIHKDNCHIMMILKLTINYKANFTQTLLLLTIIHAYYIVILSVSLIDSQLINSSRQKMPDILSLNSFLLFCFLPNICSIAASPDRLQSKTLIQLVSEYDQEIPQSQTADNPMAPRGRATQPSRDTRKTDEAKQPALLSPSR